MIETEVFALVYAVPDEERGAAGSAVQLARSKGLPHQLSVVSGVREAEARGSHPRRRPTPDRQVGRPGDRSILC